MTLHMPTWIRLRRLTVSMWRNFCASRRRVTWVTWIVTWNHLRNLKFMPPIVGKTSLWLNLIEFFLREEGKNMYVVSIIPQQMAWEVAHPAVLLCGSRKNQLDRDTKPPYKKKKHEYPHEAGFDWMTHVFEANLWIATGYTRSQFHYDKEWNVNCLLSGTKRWIFLDPLLGLGTSSPFGIPGLHLEGLP